MTLTECLHLACVLEATARKPGNVHRFADFDDLTYLDFILSAQAVAPILARTPELGVGPAILESIRATRRFVRTNTNLGIVLLLAPLAAAESSDQLESVLDRLTVRDTRTVFEAIRLASPGGLGNAPDQDVRDEPTLPLRQVMALAADRDLVARQYSNGFRDVLEIGVPALSTAGAVEDRIIHAHLTLLAHTPDTHIARRAGMDIAAEATQRAADVLAGRYSLAEFDAWLRADGHRRNPGAAADLVTASLFVALQNGILTFPASFARSPGSAP